MAERQGSEVAETVAIARAQEELRQERETFDQRKLQDRRWFAMRLVMGWIAVVLLPGIGGVAGWVLLNYSRFPTATVTIASAALLGDVVGVVVAVWRVVLGSGPQVLEPVATPRGASGQGKKRG